MYSDENKNQILKTNTKITRPRPQEIHQVHLTLKLVNATTDLHSSDVWSTE